MRYVMALCIFLTLNGCDVGNPMSKLEGAWKFKTERFSYPNNPQNNHIMSGNLIIGEMIYGIHTPPDKYGGLYRKLV